MPSIESQVEWYITYNFAVYHMGTAIKFANQAAKIECDNTIDDLSVFFSEMRTYVSSTIILSVCALEANINEHLAASDGILKDYKHEERALILEMLDSRSIKEKYQLGLILNKKSPLQFDKEPFESFQYLIQFRNSLVHYKPETDKDLKTSKKLEQKLCNKIKINPNAKNKDFFLTRRAMSYSCAKWAVNTALVFSKAYSKMLCISDKFPRFQNLK